MKYKIEKNTVQETLIIPLYARKVCSELYPNLYRDETAVRLIDEIDYDFSTLAKRSQSMMQHFVQKAVKKLLNSSSSVMHLIFLYYLLPMWLDLQQQNAAKEDLQKLWLNLHMHLQMLPFLRLACLPVMLTEVQQ